MRRAALFGTIACTLLAMDDAAAQEVGETVTVTGCVAQEVDEDDTEFLLTDAGGLVIDFEEIELSEDEDVELFGHVGHRVELTGIVLAEADAEPAAELEADIDDDIDVEDDDLEEALEDDDLDVDDLDVDDLEEDIDVDVDVDEDDAEIEYEAEVDDDDDVEIGIVGDDETDDDISILVLSVRPLAQACLVAE